MQYSQQESPSTKQVLVVQQKYVVETDVRDMIERYTCFTLYSRISTPFKVIFPEVGS